MALDSGCGGRRSTHTTIHGDDALVCAHPDDDPRRRRKVVFYMTNRDVDVGMSPVYNSTNKAEVAGSWPVRIPYYTHFQNAVMMV